MFLKLSVLTWQNGVSPFFVSFVCLLATPIFTFADFRKKNERYIKRFFFLLSC